LSTVKLLQLTKLSVYFCQLGLRRILVVDWDLHHGNGTQKCFEDDSSVLFFSTHQFPSYPGSGKFRDFRIPSKRSYENWQDYKLPTWCDFNK